MNNSTRIVAEFLQIRKFNEEFARVAHFTEEELREVQNTTFWEYAYKLDDGYALGLENGALLLLQAIEKEKQFMNEQIGVAVNYN